MTVLLLRYHEGWGHLLDILDKLEFLIKVFFMAVVFLERGLIWVLGWLTIRGSGWLGYGGPMCVLFV